MINEQFEMILASAISGLMGLTPLLLFVLGITSGYTGSNLVLLFFLRRAYKNKSIP